MDSVYKIVKTKKELLQLIQYCKDTKYASVDFETSGNTPRDPNFYPTILGVSFQIGSGWIIPLGHKNSPFKKHWKRILGIFAKEVWENPSITKIVWNATFEMKIFHHYGFQVRGRLLDGILAKYLLSEERPHGLKETVDRFLPDFAGYDLEGQPGRKASKEAIYNFWTNVELEELSKYCALDVDTTFRLTMDFEDKLIKGGFYRLFRNLYMPLVHVFSLSNYEGMFVDRKYVSWLETYYESLIKEKEKEIFSIPLIEEFNDYYIDSKVSEYIQELEESIDYDGLSDRQIELREEKISRVEAGEPVTKKEAALFEGINFGSPKQLIELLYDSEEGFEFPVLEKSKTGNPSTAESTLLKLLPMDDSGFVQVLLDYRALKKTYTSFISPILGEHITHEDRIHPSFLLFGTTSARISSRNPNLQQIPRGTTDQWVKKMFIPPKGHLYLETDGSQMELRVAAELSGDKHMLEIYNTGKNIHVQTASQVYNEDYDLIQKARKDPNHPRHEEMTVKHKAAKVLNFTIFYGAGEGKVSEILTQVTKQRHTREEARELIEAWFAAFPGAKKWIDKTKHLAKKKGYVKNMFGFKRRLPILLENPKYLPGSERGKYGEAERVSVNAIIQGSASMITLWLTIVIYEAVLKGELPSYLRMITEVHDSIEYYPKVEDTKMVVEKLETYAKELPGIKEYLGNTLYKVPMKFSTEVGINWGLMVEANRIEDYEKFYKEEWDKYNSTDFPHIQY